MLVGTANNDDAHPERTKTASQFKFSNGETVYIYTTSTQPTLSSPPQDPKISQLMEQLGSLDAENVALCQSLGIEDYAAAEVLVKAHINRLHRYNETKDAGQMLLGKLALIEGTTTRDLYPAFDLDFED